MTVSHITLFLAAFFLVAIFLPLVRWLAERAGFVDRPGGRKKHEDSIAPIGGLAVFPVFMAVAAFCGVACDADRALYAYLFAAICLLLVTGALDDWKTVPPRIKFAMQFIAAFLIVVPGQAKIVAMGDLFGFGAFGLGFVAVPFSVIAVVLLINAVNLMDGLDGLAGGKGFIVMLWLSVACVAADAPELALTAALMGALGGFLLYNLRHPLRARASVFLGDSGSLALGLCLAWFCIHLANDASPVIRPITVAWLLALPIFDTCGQFARRVSQGRHPFDADHDHFHHHFIYAGFPVAQATAIILALGFITGLFGVVGIWIGLPEAALTYPWIALLLAHIYMSMRPHRFRRLVAKFRRGATSE